MDIFDKIGITVATIGKQVGKKAKDVSDMANLNIEYKKAKTDLEMLYATLGRKYFKENAENLDAITEDYADSIRIIKVQQERVNSIKKEIDEMEQ